MNLYNPNCLQNKNCWNAFFLLKRICICKMKQKHINDCRKIRRVKKSIHLLVEYWCFLSLFATTNCGISVRRLNNNRFFLTLACIHPFSRLLKKNYFDQIKIKGGALAEKSRKRQTTKQTIRFYNDNPIKLHTCQCISSLIGCKWHRVLLFDAVIFIFYFWFWFWFCCFFFLLHRFLILFLRQFSASVTFNSTRQPFQPILFY